MKAGRLAEKKERMKAVLKAAPLDHKLVVLMAEMKVGKWEPW